MNIKEEILFANSNRLIILIFNDGFTLTIFLIKETINLH